MILEKWDPILLWTFQFRWNDVWLNVRAKKFSVHMGGVA